MVPEKTQLPSALPEDERAEPGIKKRPKLSLLKTREEKNTSDYLRNYALETLAIFFWLYAITKLFIFDIDIWVVSALVPDYLWMLDFRVLILLGIVSLTWLWVGTRDIVVWFFYIAFYPIVLFAIRLPIFIVKQKSWLLALVTLNAIVTFFKNLKYKLIFATLFLVSFAAAVFAQAGYILPVAAGALIVLVLVTYVKAFSAALKPTVIFQIYSKFLKSVRNLGHASFALDIEIRDLPVELMKPSQREKWNTNLQTSVLFNRFCLFAARKLRDYQRSDWRIIPSIFGFLYLIAFTVVTFSGAYFSLFKWEPALFSFTQPPTFFTFIYFSFNNLVLNPTAELAPAMPLSQGLYMLQAFLSLIAVVILATLYVSHRAQRLSSELDEVIAGVEAEADSMESFIRAEYKMPNISAAIEHLKEAKSGLVQVIYWLSKGVE